MKLVAECTKPKIYEFNLHLLGKKDILQFNISMDNILGLQIGKGFE